MDSGELYPASVAVADDPRPRTTRLGDLLLIAVADVAVDHERLEGRGVSPDHDVPFDIRYAKGRDPQLTAAIEILMGKIN